MVSTTDPPPPPEPLDHERLIMYLLECVVYGRLPRGSINEAAAHFGCTRQTVSAVFRARVDDPPESARGVARVWTQEAIQETLDAVPAMERTSYRALEAATGISRSTLARAVTNKDGVRRVTGFASSYLNPSQMNKRIEFALSFVEPAFGGGYKFNSMMNIIHIDEKWFYITKKRKAYYITDNEDVPHFAVTNANHLTKVLLLVAVGRPRCDPHTRQWFDGKLGMWPFVETVAAQRSSKNRPAGTPQLKCISITKESYKQCLIDNVIPTIKARWPGIKTVTVQQDNATPHASAYSEAVREAGCSDGWNISFKNQPPRSPDFNVLDLGFFSSIQAVQFQKRAYNVEQLVHVVKESFAELEPVKLSKCFLTLQSVLEQAMLDRGGNAYKIPHLGNDKLLRLGELPRSLPCSTEAVEIAEAALDEVVV